jgi:hypothetical protein
MEKTAFPFVPSLLYFFAVFYNRNMLKSGSLNRHRTKVTPSPGTTHETLRNAGSHPIAGELPSITVLLHHSG